MSFSKKSLIYIAGHTGLVGSAIYRKLQSHNYKNILTKSHKELDLENQNKTFNFFKKNKPEIVIIAAAKVGGIHANNFYSADFLLKNLQIQNNIFYAAHTLGVKKLFFLGSSCIYPKKTPQPISETALLTGQLESTNRSYAIAKIAGVEACRAFNKQYGTKWLALMHSNLYGPGDNYDLENSHVLPALINKIHKAKLSNKKNVEIWGSGKPKREFLFVDDLADALLFILELKEKNFLELLKQDATPLINIGTGKDITIKKLASEIAKIIGYKGDFIFNTSKPDGTPQKVMDVSKINSIGWKYKTDLNFGLKLTYKDYTKFIGKYNLNKSL